MPTTGIDIKVDVKLLKKSGDGTQCFICKERIFGNRFIYCVIVFGKIIDSKIQLCESCRELLI